MKFRLEKSKIKKYDFIDLARYTTTIDGRWTCSSDGNATIDDKTT